MWIFDQDMSFAMVIKDDRDKQDDNLGLWCPATGLCQGFERSEWIGHRVWAACSMSRKSILMTGLRETLKTLKTTYVTGLIQRHRDYSLGLDCLFSADPIEGNAYSLGVPAERCRCRYHPLETKVLPSRCSSGQWTRQPQPMIM